MEEILASIRRIISEEESAPAEEPLELSQPIADSEEALSIPDLEDDIVFENDAAPEPPPLRQDPTPATAWVTAPAPPPEAIVSQPVVSQAATAMSRLAGTLRIADTQGQTLEGVVRELLTPMLREWLDANLPAIVEAKVEAELERIARLAR